MGLSSPRLFVLFFVGVALILAKSGEAAPPGGLVAGGYVPIPDPGNAEIQEVAKFAAEQMGVTLTRVLGGQQQVVAGMNYRLVIGAVRSSGVIRTENLFLAVVYDKPWENFRRLTASRLIV
ncbi:cysteine proteinase inhibitor 8-like [Wolffia australiana]